ncbi:AP2 domain-containing protein [Clostridium sp. ZBS3]|uniref:AP2 domain-containing protein n=1 Tax=Clostridium sp. ZBS3 TaxID=2949975 RepID=UPI0020794C0D|nr:AP2 domain-containing protein [Clostridium sp. ZBS3]
MAKRIDLNLIGRTFSRLLVIDYASKGKYGHNQFKCVCKCGNKLIVTASNLLSGNTKSCGCLNIEKCTSRINGEYARKRNKESSTAYKGTRICNLDRHTQVNNTSGVTGVYWNAQKHKWYAKIKFRQKQIHLGYFEYKEDAMKARKEAEEKYFKPIIEEYKNLKIEEND